MIENCRVDDCQKRILIGALEEIRRIVHTPTRDTAFKGASDHFASDFAAIRKIISKTIGQGNP